MNYKENALSFLPLTRKCKPNNLPSKIELSKQDIKKEHQELGEKIIFLLLENYQSGNWTLQTYGSFREFVLTLSDEELNIFLPTIITCLETPNDVLLSELEKIAQRVEFYPEVERAYDEETKKFHIQEKEITIKDCYFLLGTIKSKLNQLMRFTIDEVVSTKEEYQKYLTKLETGEVFENISILEEFSYLEDTIFYEVVLAYQKEYLKFLKKLIRKTNNEIREKEDLGEEINFFLAHVREMQYQEYLKKNKWHALNKRRRRS